LPIQIVKPGTQIDFLGKWRICVTISAALVLIGLLGIQVRGFRLGIDFAGGTEVQVRFLDAGGVDEGDIRDVVNGLGIPNASVTRFGGADSQEFLIKFRGGREAEAVTEAEDGSSAEPEQVEGGEASDETELQEADAAPEEAETAGAAAEDRIFLLQETLEETIGPLEVQRVEFVGPKVGAELREAGVKAMAIACLLILVYIGFRFSTRFAPGPCSPWSTTWRSPPRSGSSWAWSSISACSRRSSPSSATA
jgi:preprotein translocase subunit SecF